MEISFMQHTLIGIWQKITVCPLNQVNVPFTNGKKQGIFTPCYAINLTFCKTKKRQSKDETKAAVLSKASYQLSRLPIRPLATLSLVCKQALLFGSRSQPLTPQCYHTYSLYCSSYISKEANQECSTIKSCFSW